MSEDRQDYEDWWPLRTLAEKVGVPERQLYEWERKRAKNGFPEPKEKLGRYKVFDLYEVRRWVTLYRRATEGMGNARDLRNARGA